MAIKRSASGKIVPKRFSVKRLERAADANVGFCVACGASRDGCEPDARRYPCESCKMNLVFGAEEIALQGWVKLSEGIELYQGDCREILKTLPDNSIDSVPTDPPYALVSIVKRFGSPDAAPAKGDVYLRASSGFMGKQWDTGETAFSVEFWREIYRVLKPGGHVAAFGSSRGYHRMACAIEDAGFEIRDSLMWIYGTGFPKSHNQGDGWGTALKPAFEPIVLARKPLSEKTVAANVQKWGTGAINIDGCRVASDQNDDSRRVRNNAASIGFGGSDVPFTSGGKEGRWPANVCHDGSEEVVGLFPRAKGAVSNGKKGVNEIYGLGWGEQAQKPGYADDGSAARFFYSAKASKADRDGSKHPTVKPIALMQWLARLITPPGGTILDPFAGSGTTGVAAQREGFKCVLIEREAEYSNDILRRFEAA